MINIFERQNDMLDGEETDTDGGVGCRERQGGQEEEKCHEILLITKIAYLTVENSAKQL